VVVVPSSHRDAIGGTSQDLTGVGVYRRDAPGAQVTGIYTSLNILVVDGHNYAVLAQGHLALPDDGSSNFFRAAPELYFQKVGADLWPDTLAGLTPGRKVAIEDALNTLLQKEFPATFHAMGMIP